MFNVGDKVRLKPKSDFPYRRDYDDYYRWFGDQLLTIKYAGTSLSFEESPFVGLETVFCLPESEQDNEALIKLKDEFDKLCLQLET